MELFRQFLNFINLFLRNRLFGVIILILLLIIILYHVLLFFFRDLKYKRFLKKYEDPQDIKIEDLSELPVVNLIVPAWKEGVSFEYCLSAIKKLNYPKLNVIINAGGNDETIKIANKKCTLYLIINGAIFFPISSISAKYFIA